MYLSITIKLIIGLIALLVVIRLLGKKTLSEITPFDIVYLILLGSFLEEGIYDDKVSLLHILYSVALWGVLVFLIEVLAARVDWVRRLMKGETANLIENGRINQERLKQAHMEMEQLRILMREKGYFSLSEIEFATLETNGGLSILPKAKAEPVTPDMLNIHPEENAPTYMLIDEGKVEKKELAIAGKDKHWLLKEIQKEGYEKPEGIFYAEWSEKNGLLIYPYDNEGERH